MSCTSNGSTATTWFSHGFNAQCPYAIPSVSGHRYFLTLVDDYSRFTWIIFLKLISETRKHIINFVSYIENQFKTKLKCLRSDNGCEFLTTDFFSF